MPKQKRWEVKRKLDEVVSNIERAQLHLAFVGRLYEKPHPQLYDYLCKVMTILEEAKLAVSKFRDFI